MALHVGCTGVGTIHRRSTPVGSLADKTGAARVSLMASDADDDDTPKADDGHSQPLRIESRMVIVGGTLKDPLVFRYTKVVEGQTFFHLVKKDRAVQFLLGASRKAGVEADVISRLTKMRNDVVAHILDPPAEFDLGVDQQPPSAKKRRSSINMGEVPKIVTIQVPAVGDVQAGFIRVLAGIQSGKHGKLHIELVDYVMNWLHAAASDETFVNDADTGKLPRHITYDNVRKAYKVRWRTVTRWVPEASSEEPLLDAMKLLESVQLQSLPDHLAPNPEQSEAGDIG